MSESTTPRLRRLAQASQPRAHAAAPTGAAAGVGDEVQQRDEERASAVDVQEERCELCGCALYGTHRHLVELSSGSLVCACRPCSLLFERDGSGAGRYKPVPERRIRLEDAMLEDEDWEQLQIPVQIAFFFHSSSAERLIACYPSPMGATESTLQLDCWERLERANPILAEMEPDVEALLVNRAKGARDQWLVGIDECYSLVGLMMTKWRGLAGGSEVWRAIDLFFEELDSRARSAAGRS